MKFSFLFFILTAFCFAAKDPAIVRFANGEQLSGNVVALDLQTLTWKSEHLKEQTQFHLNQIKNLDLPSKLDYKSIREAGHEAVLELTNGDSVKGLLTGLNEHEIILNTWYAGEMVFKRLNVKSITISRSYKVLYIGPETKEEWKQIDNEDSWDFGNNEFVSKSSGGIARDIDFTDEVRISYDLAWKGTIKSKVVFFTSDITSAQPKSGYELTLEGSSAIIRRLNDHKPLNARSNSMRIQYNDKARIDIRISRQTKKIMVFIDDRLKATWHDKDMDEIQGKGLIYISDSNYELKLSNILVAELDDDIDPSVVNEVPLHQQRINLHFQRGMAPEIPKPKQLPEGRMMLANGDSVEGEVLGVEGEKIKIKTPFAEISFPVYRIKNIAMKTKGLEEPKRERGDVRALLADGSSMVFRLDDVKDGKLIGYSQNFGSAEFLQTAFKRIEFDPYGMNKPR